MGLAHQRQKPREFPTVDNVANPLNCDGSHNSSLGVLIAHLKMAAAAVADVKL